MTFTTELEQIAGTLAALCKQCFGPCGEKTLVFRPPDAPIMTGEGQTVLTAWKRGLNGQDPVATFLLAAANGVHQQLGDGSSEFILLVDAVVRQNARNGVDRACLSKAYAELKWELQREMQTPKSDLFTLYRAVPMELDASTLQPTKQFRETCRHILESALWGVLGEQLVEFLTNLVLDWVFTQSPYRSNKSFTPKTTDKLLYQRVQHFLKRASDAIIFMATPSVYASSVVPCDEFILQKSMEFSPFLQSCSGGREIVPFVCFTCPLSLSAGSNHVDIVTKIDEATFTAQDALKLFLGQFIRHLRNRLNVQLVLSTEALEESIVAACARQKIACVQLVEPDDLEALCITAGIFPLASVLDEIRVNEHVGVCTKGVVRVRFQQQECLRLRGLSKRARQATERPRGRGFQDIVVPQLLLHAPTKGVYKQYYASIIKSLRVLGSWWKPVVFDSEGLDLSHSFGTAYCCRGGGATELAIARWLLKKNKCRYEGIPRDGTSRCMARTTLANALIEVVGILRNNLNPTGRNASDHELPSNQSIAKQRQVLLDSFQHKDHLETFYGYTLTHSCVLHTLAGPIQVPKLVFGDPEQYGLVHPRRRIETLLFLVLQTVEQLFRIDYVIVRTAASTINSR